MCSCNRSKWAEALSDFYQKAGANLSFSTDFIEFFFNFEEGLSKISVIFTGCAPVVDPGQGREPMRHLLGYGSIWSIFIKSQVRGEPHMMYFAA